LIHKLPILRPLSFTDLSERSEPKLGGAEWWRGVTEK